MGRPERRPGEEQVGGQIRSSIVLGCASSPTTSSREKGVPFGRSVAIMHGGNLIADTMRAQTVAPRIPALQHGEFWLTESIAIVEYIEEVFPPPRWPAVLPRNPRDRARSRQVSLLTRTELTALRRERPTWMIFYGASPLPLGTHAREDADELLDAATRLLAGQREHLFGDFCIADLDLAFALQRLLATGHEVPADVAAYVERVWRRPSVREFVEHPRPPNAPVL